MYSSFMFQEDSAGSRFSLLVSERRDYSWQARAVIVITSSGISLSARGRARVGRGRGRWRVVRYIPTQSKTRDEPGAQEGES